MSEINEILNDIQQHCRREYSEHVTDPSIGRGLIRIKGFSQQQKVWIVNKESQMRSRIEFDINNTFKGTSISGPLQHLDDGGVCVSKNKMYARLLLENYEGNHICKTIDGRVFNFMIKNSEAYNNESGRVGEIRFGIAGDKSWSRYPSLQAALEALNKNQESITERQIAEEEAIRRAEELRRLKQEEEARKAEEEAKKLEAERKALEAERQAIIDKYSQTAAFVRQQVTLRNNPVLDKHQNDAKFSNIYNGIAEVINGGPGTGKTTTMIQRLKLLIDSDDLKDYRINHEDCKLTDREISLASGDDKWIYFSPNQLLKKYLENNMVYEGLGRAPIQTKVWKDFLRIAVRDSYHLAGEDCPFDFPKHRYEDVPLYVDGHFDIITGFIEYFITLTKEKFQKIAKVDTSKYEWKILGSIITKECSKINEVHSLSDLLRFLIHMETVDSNIIIDGKRLSSGSNILRLYNDHIQLLSDQCLVKIKKDEETYSKVEKFINDSLKAKKAEDENDEDDELSDMEQNYGDVTLVLNQRLKSLLKALALKSIDSSVKIQGNAKILYDLIQSYIDNEKLKAQSSNAFFVKYVYPAVNGSLNTIFSSVPRIYKSFRKNLTEDLSSHFNPDILQYILETSKNRALCPQEQALLVGFINRICRDFYKVRKSDFEGSNHKYVLAYKELCRPVIGVDEATDYSIVDFFGIRSFGHYEIESFTICGDSMQMMREDGIKDWTVLNHPLIFDKLEIKGLNISYRQSKELMELAGKIYQAELGRPAPYECYLKNEDTPKPLWLESDDIDEKAEWITQRVLEINTKYGQMPTIAIFTKDKMTCEHLKEALDDCDDLTKAGIQVKVCSEESLAGNKILRIFPIDEVKGMEFESVFFYDIDDIESTRLVNKYLYVGISRAAFYLAVTSNGHSQRINELLSGYFSKGGDWKQ